MICFARRILCFALLLLALPLDAQTPPGGTAKITGLSREFIEAKIAEVQASSDLADDVRSRLLEQYRKTVTQLQAVESQRALAEGFEHAGATAAAEAARIRHEAEAKVVESIELGVAPDAALGTIESVLRKEQANRAALAAKLTEIEAQLATELDRPNVVRARLLEANRRAAEIATELERVVPTASPEETAKNWLLQARRLALGAETRALDEELLSQPMRLELLVAERDLVALGAERSQVRVRELEELLLERRRHETMQAAADAAAALREVQDKHPVVQGLAEKNARLTAEIAALAERLEYAAGLEETAREFEDRVENEFRAAKEKLEVGGLSQALGMVLQEQRRAMPDITMARKQVAAREGEIAEAALRQIQYREERRGLLNLSEYTADLISRLPAEEAATVDEASRSELTQLAQTRRKLLDQVLERGRANLRSLGELDFAQRGLIETVTAADQYLASRLLWIRTAPALTAADVVAIPSEVASILAPTRWREVGEVLVEQLLHAPTFALGVILFAGLWWSRGRIRAALRDTGKGVGNPMSDRFGSTARALVWTGLLAAPLPLLLAVVAWHLEAAPNATEFVRAVASSLSWTARLLAPLGFFRAVCRDGGIADIHFGWTAATRRALRSQLTRLMVGFLSFGFVVWLLIHYRQVAFTGGLGRLCLLGILASVGVFAFGMLHPNRGALRAHLGDESDGILFRLRSVWVGLAIAVIMILAWLAIAGYFYAAAALVSRSVLTVALAFAIVVLHELVVRWLTLTQGRLAYRAAVERREAARLARAKAERPETPGSEAVSVPEDDMAIDIAALSEDAKKMLDAMLWIVAVLGMWMVWWTVLPALDMLDEITLWSKVAIVGGEEVEVPVSLSDAAAALLLVVLTVVATRRLPSLLQFAILQRLDVSAGSQYAISTLTRYAVGAIGFIVVTNTIGLDWSQLQWLVAALGVGIGFGLQEIVANFISGLIILFERPVRVGDVVTVGDTDGVVTRIRIRATTIRTYDRKELLVPNKEFVTSRLLNWSLSDQISRLTVSVGIAYGSDVGRAMTLLMEVATQHPRVIADPAPFVVFDAFGDNSLSLRLRCYVDSLEFRLTTLSELHQEVHQRFNDAGISISFPQRDVHLSTATPLDVRLHPVVGDGNAAVGA